MHSPLGEGLHPRRRRRALRVAILALAVLSAGAWASTALAGAISINGGSALEFGQGTRETTVCDSTLNSSLTTSWYQSGPYFAVDSIVVSSLSGCVGKKLRIQLLDATGSALDLGASGQSFVTVTVPASDGSATTADATGATASLASGSLTVSVAPTTKVNAASVSRIAIETKD